MKKTIAFALIVALCMGAPLMTAMAETDWSPFGRFYDITHGPKEQFTPENLLSATEGLGERGYYFDSEDKVNADWAFYITVANYTVGWTWDVVIQGDSLEYGGTAYAALSDGTRIDGVVERFRDGERISIVFPHDKAGRGLQYAAVIWFRGVSGIEASTVFEVNNGIIFREFGWDAGDWSISPYAPTPRNGIESIQNILYLGIDGYECIRPNTLTLRYPAPKTPLNIDGLLGDYTGDFGDAIGSVSMRIYKEDSTYVVRYYYRGYSALCRMITNRDGTVFAENAFIEENLTRFPGATFYDYDGTTLTGVDYTGRGVRYTRVGSPVSPPLDAPSSWAAENVNAAIAAGLVPDSIKNAGWQRNTTREAAAEAMVALISATKGATMEAIAAENGWDLTANHFSDTSNPAVAFLRCAGIVQGVGDNKYNPNGEYSRADTVTLLGIIAEKIYGLDVRGKNPFTDVPAYAAPYIGYAAEVFGVKGIGGGLFDPDSPMSNQMTAYLSYIAYQAWK